MSNDYPDGDDPTRAYRREDAIQGSSDQPFDEPEATRLQRSVPAYDPYREPAPANYAPAPVVEAADRPGIAAQLVAVGLVCLLLGLGLGYFLFKDVGGDANDVSNTTSTTIAVTSTTEEVSSTTSTTAASTTTERSTTSTTARPTTTTQRSTTTTTSSTTTTAQ